MKQLLTIVFIGLVFTSCGPNKEQIKEEERMRMEAIEELEEEKRLKEEKNSSTIKIGNLEVMTEDLGDMNWDEAKKACKNLGDGWRLPKKYELNLLYENKEKIGGFANIYYWRSSEGGDGNAWGQNFDNGHQYVNGKYDTDYVRAVRAF